MSNESATSLLSGLLNDARDLMTTHAKMVKVEVKDELGELKSTIVRTGVALAGVILAGLLITQAGALGLSAATDLPLWASSLILGVIVGIAGYVVYRGRAPKQQIDLIPDDSIARVRHDLDRVAKAAT